MHHSLHSFFVEENQIPLDSESSKYLLIIFPLQQWFAYKRFAYCLYIPIARG